jgi:hypothetical protein
LPIYARANVEKICSLLGFRTSYNGTCLSLFIYARTVVGVVQLVRRGPRAQAGARFDRARRNLPQRSWQKYTEITKKLQKLQRN